MVESSSYRIELLNEENYLPWKRRVIAILRDKELLGYVDGRIKRPVPTNASSPTPDEIKEIDAWDIKDGKAQSQIELSLGDSQMVHISGAKTSADMWKQLTTVKESSGTLGIMTYRRRLYRTFADENKDIPTHIKELRSIQEQLQTMGDIIDDDEMVMLINTWIFRCTKCCCKFEFKSYFADTQWNLYQKIFNYKS